MPGGGCGDSNTYVHTTMLLYVYVRTVIIAPADTEQVAVIALHAMWHDLIVLLPVSIKAMYTITTVYFLMYNKAQGMLRMLLLITQRHCIEK